MSPSRHVPNQSNRAANSGHEQIQPAIVINVADQQPTPDQGWKTKLPVVGRGFDESAIGRSGEYLRWLSISRPERSDLVRSRLGYRTRGPSDSTIHHRQV